MNLVNFDFNYKPSNNINSQLAEEKFKEFLIKVQDDLNNCLFIFLEANGQSFKKLKKTNKDLDEVFKDNLDYKEFIQIYLDSKNEIEKILYTEDYGYESKKAISDNVFKVKSFIKEKYPDVNIEKNGFLLNKIFAIVLILLIIYILSKS